MACPEQRRGARHVPLGAAFGPDLRLVPRLPALRGADGAFVRLVAPPNGAATRSSPSTPAPQVLPDAVEDARGALLGEELS